MAVVTVNSDFGFDIRDFNFTELFDAASYQGTAKYFEARYENGLADIWYGSGFSYADGNVPSSGTITTYIRAFNGVSILTAANISIPVSNVYSAAQTASTSDDQTIVATALAGDDTFTGGGLSDYLDGFAGNDTINGLGGSDTLFGGAGNDTLNGGDGGDDMTGGAGNDIYRVDNADDRVTEGTGEGTTDRVVASASYTLTASAQIEILGVQGGSSTSNAINLTGNNVGQAIYGNAGANVLSGGGGNDSLVGYGGNDVLNGGTGADRMNGGTGDDTFYADNALDRVLEATGQGNDTLLSSVSYGLSAGSEVENLSFRERFATTNLNLQGNEFGQTIIGNAGVNILTGKGGNDTLTGGRGNDQFFFNAALDEATNVDSITDFSNSSGNNDTVRLENAIFTALTQTGRLAAAFFAVTEDGKAADGNDHIILQEVSGKLFYDADGVGGVDGVQFATITNIEAIPGATITAYDFFVV